MPSVSFMAPVGATVFGIILKPNDPSMALDASAAGETWKALDFDDADQQVAFSGAVEAPGGFEQQMVMEIPAGITTLTIYTIRVCTADEVLGEVTYDSRIADDLFSETGILGMETRDLEPPQYPLTTPTRRDSILLSDDVVYIAPGEKIKIGWLFGKTSLITNGGAVPAQLADPEGLSGELSATKTGGGIAPAWANIWVEASVDAVIDTVQQVTVKLTNSRGSEFYLAATVKVRDPTLGG